MFAHESRAAFGLVSLLMAVSSSTAAAQWYPTGGYCVRPVAQTYYRTVPVTEYRTIRQTVTRPIVETEYVDEPVTMYRQVAETKTIDVPTVSYQDITEYRTVQQNHDHWTMNYQFVPQMTPWQYDNRPDVIGLLNRTGFALLSLISPPIVAVPQYIPNTVMATYPVTRRVALQGTQKVSYNVTKLVPYTTTRKVAVNRTRYIEEEQVAVQPVTVMRSIPVGMRTAYAYAPMIDEGLRTVLQPTSEPVRQHSRTADSHGKLDSSDSQSSGIPARKSSLSDPLNSPTSQAPQPVLRRAGMFTPPAGRTPAMIRVGQWVARNGSAGSPVPVLVDANRQERTSR